MASVGPQRHRRERKRTLWVTKGSYFDNCHLPHPTTHVDSPLNGVLKTMNKRTKSCKSYLSYKIVTLQYALTSVDTVTVGYATTNERMLQRTMV